MDIRELALKHNDYIIEQRRYFHAHPELPEYEFETTNAIVAQLEEMGLSVDRFEGIEGCVATLVGANPGKTVLLRADIDGLPVNEKTGLPFTSQNPGIMHACGHDTHIAMQLGAAKILCDVKESLNGTVKFFFQPAEELVKGAKAAIAQGLLEGVDGAFGMHIWSQLDSPKFNMDPGYRMASVDSFTLTVHGTSAHGSAPHLGADAIVAAAEVITALQSVVSRKNNPLNPMVLTIGTIHGGQRFNIIANEVSMVGAIRNFDQTSRMGTEQMIRSIAEHVAAAHGCTITLDYVYMVGSVNNASTELVELARKSAAKLYGEEVLTSFEKVCGSEDFSVIQEHVPGVYGFLGARSESVEGSGLSNHHESFTPDEDALHHGAAIAAQFAFDFLSQ